MLVTKLGLLNASTMAIVWPVPSPTMLPNMRLLTPYAPRILRRRDFALDGGRSDPNGLNLPSPPLKGPTDCTM